VGNIWNDEFREVLSDVRSLATDTLPLAGEYFRAITKD